MASLSWMWCDSVLQLSTKIRLYQALKYSVLQYTGAAETRTLLSCDEKTLEAFHMKCQRQILHIHWPQYITNAVAARTGLVPNPTDYMLYNQRTPPADELTTILQLVV